MGRQGRINTHGAVLFLLLIVILPGVAAEPPPPCIAYGYTVADNEPHLSLLGDETYVFGTQLNVISNCDNTSIYVDGVFAASSPRGSLYTYVPAGMHDIRIENDGFNASFENVTFIEAGQLFQIVNQLPSEHNPHATPYTPSQISNMELISGIGSILISWLLVVAVLWKFISNHHDRHYCMEVV